MEVTIFFFIFMNTVTLACKVSTLLDSDIDIDSGTYIYVTVYA